MIPKNKIMKKKSLKKTPLQVFRGDICGLRHFPRARLSVLLFSSDAWIRAGFSQQFPK